MNKIKNLFLLVAAALTFAACENGHENNLPNNPNHKECYEGKMVVDQNDGSFYEQNSVEVDYEIYDGKINFAMYKVKFASGMPLKLDMVVEGVDFEENNGVYTLSADGIVPYAMGGPFEQFTITKLTGVITETTMTLDFLCGEYPVTYSGSR